MMCVSEFAAGHSEFAYDICSLRHCVDYQAVMDSSALNVILYVYTGFFFLHKETQISLKYARNCASSSKDDYVCILCYQFIHTDIYT